MAFRKNKMSPEEQEAQMVNVMMDSLSKIYANKSSDEYKSHGDITASSEYKTIETMIADLKTLKNYPVNEANNMKTLFLTLHRPIFKNMVTEYIAKPNERNIIFTAVYTVGFRVLVGELSRIFASTESTDKGIKYHPDKISIKNNMMKFIVSFNESLEKRINDNIRITASLHQESVSDLIGDAIGFIVPKVKQCVNRIFSTVKNVNPISLVNTLLMRKFDNDVDALEEASELYNATYEAYKEYMRIPDSQRKEKVESKYIKNMEKYKIRMDNIRAKIEHYDQRAVTEAEDAINNTPTSTTKPNPLTGTDSTNDDYDF